MHSQHTPQTGGIGAFLRSPTGLALVVFLAIAAFYLISEHTVHVLSLLPYALFLLCPIMHLLMHSSHGGHGGQDDHSGHEHHTAHESERSEGEQR